MNYPDNFTHRLKFFTIKINESTQEDLDKALIRHGIDANDIISVVPDGRGASLHIFYKRHIFLDRKRASN